jgi:hypothetical protein
MTRLKLPFIKEYQDRHGRVRRYVRRRGRPNVPLPGVPGSAEFMAAYEAAIDAPAAALKEPKKTRRKAAEPRGPGHVYFVEAGDFIKIGFTTDWQRRIPTIQISSASPLRLLTLVQGDHDLEAALHNKFSHLRQRGEWFRKAPELISFIEGTQLAERP